MDYEDTETDRQGRKIEGIIVLLIAINILCKHNALNKCILCAKKLVWVAIFTFMEFNMVLL